MKIIICLCLSVIICHGQVPGYMGKRFVAGYGFYASPALLGSNNQGNTMLGYHHGNAETGLAFNTLHELFAEYAIKKRMSLGASIRYYKTSFDNNAECYFTYRTQYAYGGGATGDLESSSGFPSGFYHITGINYNLYAKFYGRNFVAPWGRYFIAGLALKSFTCTYDPSEMRIRISGNNSYYAPTSPYYTDFGPSKQRYFRADVLAGFGRNRIFGKRITIDYGFNVQALALAVTLFDLIEVNVLHDTNEYTGSEYIGGTSPWRVRGVNRFNAYCKIGVLIF